MNLRVNRARQLGSGGQASEASSGATRTTQKAMPGWLGRGRDKSNDDFASVLRICRTGVKWDAAGLTLATAFGGFGAQGKPTTHNLASIGWARDAQSLSHLPWYA